MKHTTTLLLTAIALTASAQAGESYSSKSSKEIIPPPAPSCLWSWFAGGSAGYVSGDWDEDIYTLHLGAEYKCDGDNCSQALYLEVGFTEKDETLDIQTSNPNVGNFFGLVDLEAEIIPITLNYKYECTLTDQLNWYVGAGAGIALVDLDIEGSGGSASFDDTTFYAHIFVGLVYNVSPSFEVFGGARYIIMDDPDLTGFSTFDDEVSLDGDVHFELGGRFNF